MDEDGYPKKLPFNFYIPVNSISFPLQKIVGVAVFCKLTLDPIVDDYDYQVGSLSTDEINLIFEFLDEGNQTVFEKEFKKMYPNMESYLTPVIREIH